MTHVDQFIAHYGYFAIFGLLMLGIVGPLIPDETILVLGGIAVHRGELSIWGAIAAGCGGSICGITVSYVLGRTGVVYALKHVPWLDRRIGKHMPEAHRWFEKFGKWTLFFGYFIAGVRHFTALVAGTSELNPGTFAAFAYPGGVIWVICFVSIGYFVGEEWESVAHRLNAAALWLAIAVAIVALVWWLARRRSTRA